MLQTCCLPGPQGRDLGGVRAGGGDQGRDEAVSEMGLAQLRGDHDLRLALDLDGCQGIKGEP